MNFYAKKLLFIFSLLISLSVYAAKPIKPAGNMQVCALQENRAAFATDYYGNLVFCVQGSCRKIMDRPGNAVPQKLACMINNNVAYVIYSNNKLYRCTSDNYLPSKASQSGCVIQVMEQ